MEPLFFVWGAYFPVLSYYGGKFKKGGFLMTDLDVQVYKELLNAEYEKLKKASIRSPDHIFH